LEIDPAEQAAPVSDLCGRCTRCLDHCPTGALPEPYRLDANRCISYWTIEHRGDFPDEVREMVGDWVFGCDICQEVCPWNLRGEARGEAIPADHPEMALPPERRELDLLGLLTLRRDEYQERFRGSPMKRTRLEGLRRNAAVALGNRGDRSAIPALEQVLRDDDPTGAGSDPDRDAESHALVRRHVAWALERLRSPDPVPSTPTVDSDGSS
jgi:epoxyqueuosine reductase